MNRLRFLTNASCNKNTTNYKHNSLIYITFFNSVKLLNYYNYLETDDYLKK